MWAYFSISVEAFLESGLEVSSFCGDTLKQECLKQILSESFKPSNMELWTRLRIYLATCWDKSCETSYWLYSHCLQARLHECLNSYGGQKLCRHSVQKICFILFYPKWLFLYFGLFRENIFLNFSLHNRRHFFNHPVIFTGPLYRLKVILMIGFRRAEDERS